MSVSRQFQQLPMFATPAELGEMASADLGGTKVKHWYADMVHHPEVVEQNNDGDYRGARDFPEYLDSMHKAVERQNGIETPVHVWHDHDNQPWLMDGHHRAKVAMDTNRLVPVVHHAQWSKDEGYRSAFNGPTADRDWDQTRV